MEPYEQVPEAKSFSDKYKILIFRDKQKCPIFAAIRKGPVAERLGKALQKLLQRFESARDLFLNDQGFKIIRF